MTLSRAAHWLFANDPALSSIDALIADAQQEWLASSGRTARRVRVELTLSFWSSSLLRVGRLLLAPNPHAMLFSLEWALTGFAWALGLQMLIRGNDPSFSTAKAVSETFVMLCWCSGFVLHPSNLSHLVPKAPNRGWWPFLQFLMFGMATLAAWLGVTDGSLWHLVAAMAVGPIGAAMAARIHAKHAHDKARP